MSVSTPVIGLLRLLQVSDSSFPTGGYAFSHGLEGLYAMGIVRETDDVRGFARTQVQETLAWQDLPAVACSWRRGDAGDMDALIEMDVLLSALKPVPAFRSSSIRIGRQLLEAALPLHADGIALRYLEAVREGNAPGHHAVAFGVVTQAAEIPEIDAVTAFGASALSGYVAAAVRLGIIGQGAAQGIIASLEPDLTTAIEQARSLEPDQFGGYAPLVDIAGMRQPSLAARLFAS